MSAAARGAAGVVAAGVAALVLAACGAGSSGSASASATHSPAAASSTGHSTPPPRSAAASAPAPVFGRTPAQARADIARVVAKAPGHAAGVSAVDLASGRTMTGGYRGAMWTASMYKLLVLETLLREHGALSGGELDEATRMIENSDNAAGYSLWEAGGANSGLQATLRALRMTHSTADGSDPTFTRLTPADAVQLTRALVRPGVLSAAARAQALRLMRNVESDQRWGVGVVADKGTDFANKNGWLSVDNGNPAGEDDGGRWVVSSVGVVTVHGRQVLMAAMSEHNASMPAGIRVIQALAKDAAAIVAS